MKENMWTVLVTSVIFQCFGEVDAHSVRLVPSPIAEVKEGSTLNLHCSYNGFNNPDCINWYLNNDTIGLVIEASSCKYLITPEQYEIDRYNISCHETKFNLSIANISKGDHQDTWECDTTVTPMSPPQKASTRIVMIDAGKNGQFDEPKTVGVMGIVGGVISAFTVIIIAAAGYFHYRKRNANCLLGLAVRQFGAAVQDDAESVYENRNDVYLCLLRNNGDLIYADLELAIPDDSNGKPIIHGLQNRTEYAEIAFGKRGEPLPDSDDENESLGTE